MIKSLTFSLIRCRLRSNESFCFECNDIRTKMENTHFECFHVEHITIFDLSRSQSWRTCPCIRVLELHHWYAYCGCDVVAAAAVLFFFIFLSYENIIRFVFVCSQLVSWDLIQFVVNLFSFVTSSIPCNTQMYFSISWNGFHLNHDCVCLRTHG